MSSYDYDFPVYKKVFLSEAFSVLADTLIQLAASLGSFSGPVGYYLKNKLYSAGVFKHLMWAWIPKWLDGIDYYGTDADIAYELSVLADLCLRKSKIYKSQENKGKYQFTYPG